MGFLSCPLSYFKDVIASFLWGFSKPLLFPATIPQPGKSDRPQKESILRTQAKKIGKVALRVRKVGKYGFHM